MKPTPFSLGAFAVLLPLIPGPFQGQDSAGATARQGTGGLRRVAPAQEEHKGQSLAQLFARDFVRSDWEERLTQEDLDQREQSFADLLKRARLDPVARTFLEDLAREPAGGELAWTARLALRELGRARFSFHGFLPGADPLGLANRRPGSGVFGNDLEQLLQEWMSADGLGLLLPRSLPGTRALVPQSGASQRGVRIEQTDKGARVEVHANIDGQQQTRTFEGASLAEILEQNPELQQELQGLSMLARAQGERLVPHGRARPLRTDKLGVMVQKVTPQQARELGLAGQGLYVEHSYPETFAHLLGVASGDVLLELNGSPLCEIDDIEKAMRQRRADDELTLVWLDGLGQRQKKTWRPSEKDR